MFSVTLNPGFALLIGAVLTLASPQMFRSFVMAGAGFVGLFLLLTPDFGAYNSFGQIGLTIVPLTLDALNQIFGIAFLTSVILLAAAANVRRDRAEDAALMLMAGAATSALFVGDILTFVAASALAGLAAAWVVFASPREGADGAGVRLLVWRGLESLLLLAGLALHLSTGAENSMLARMDVRKLGDAMIFAGLLIRAGAPLAHVWFKDAVAHASPVGAAAIGVYSSMIGVYALARLFPAEYTLIFAGLGMMAVGVFYSAAEEDIRRAGAYALTAQTGFCLILIGMGSPLALAAAAAHAFTLILSFLFFAFAAGGLIARFEEAGLAGLKGRAKAAPASAFLTVLAGFAAAGAPGLGVYVSFAAALEAAAQWQDRWIWLAASAMSACLAVNIGVRPALQLYAPSADKAKPDLGDAPFPLLLAALLAAFLCFAVSLRPDWLYQLAPARFSFAPYALDRLAPQIELMAAAAAVFAAASVLGLALKPAGRRFLDFDALFRGPVSSSGRWCGVVLLRLYGAAQSALARLLERAGQVLTRAARACDQPYADAGAGVWQLISICALLLLILFVRV
jgi:formate hydrogenlyase subunit 3/multisubunit Na+/H+ antiporter MnhD subunit